MNILAVSSQQLFVATESRIQVYALHPDGTLNLSIPSHALNLLNGDVMCLDQIVEKHQPDYGP